MTTDYQKINDILKESDIESSVLKKDYWDTLDMDILYKAVLIKITHLAKAGFGECDFDELMYGFLISLGFEIEYEAPLFTLEDSTLHAAKIYHFLVKTLKDQGFNLYSFDNNTCYRGYDDFDNYTLIEEFNIKTNLSWR